LSDHVDFNTLLKYLDGTASTWAGASVSYQYFWVMKQAELDKDEERNKQRSYQPFISASLHTEPLGDLDVYDTEVKLDGSEDATRSSIGMMIEKLENDGHLDFSQFVF
jgi:hypothetical protein